MADITDPAAVKFANEKIRVIADRLAITYRDAKTVLAFWDAKEIGKMMPDGKSPVVDGSASDGRTPITTTDVNAIVAVCKSIVDLCEANGNAVLNQVLKVSVNPERER